MITEEMLNTELPESSVPFSIRDNGLVCTVVDSNQTVTLFQVIEGLEIIRNREATLHFQGNALAKFIEEVSCELQKKNQK